MTRIGIGLAVLLWSTTARALPCDYVRKQIAYCDQQIRIIRESQVLTPAQRAEKARAFESTCATYHSQLSTCGQDSPRAGMGGATGPASNDPRVQALQTVAAGIQAIMGAQQAREQQERAEALAREAEQAREEAREARREADAAKREAAEARHELEVNQLSHDLEREFDTASQGFETPAAISAKARPRHACTELEQAMHPDQCGEAQAPAPVEPGGATPVEFTSGKAPAGGGSGPSQPPSLDAPAPFAVVAGAPLSDTQLLALAQQAGAVDEAAREAQVSGLAGEAFRDEPMAGFRTIASERESEAGKPIEVTADALSTFEPTEEARESMHNAGRVVGTVETKGFKELSPDSHGDLAKIDAVVEDVAADTAQNLPLPKPVKWAVETYSRAERTVETLKGTMEKARATWQRVDAFASPKAARFGTAMRRFFGDAPREGDD